MKVRIRATILLLILQTNPIHIRNVGITSCPLGDNPQILKVQRNLFLCTLFPKTCRKSKQTTILHLNHMPLLPLLRTKRGLAELIKHLRRPQVRPMLSLLHLQGAWVERERGKG